MPKHSVWVLVAFLALGASQVARAQQSESEEKKESIRDYFDLYTYDPDELHEFWQEAERRKPLSGPFGLGGYYLPPNREPGPYYGPPLQIWGRGFGTSLWRNPITGWPLQ